MSRLVLSLVIAGLLLLVGCNSGSNGDKSTDFGGLFVVSDSTVGTIVVSLNSSSLSVSDTTGFLVRVRNQDGAPVPGISVFVDTEQGLAVIDPTSGQLVTNQFGEVSGVLGCEAPGSFQAGWRLPTGTNIRTFKEVLCAGPVPAGFSGFAGAGGGGLGNNGSAGGGVDVGDDGNPGGTGTEGLRLSEIAFNDSGDVAPFSSPTLSIDTRQGDCADVGEEPDCESMFDSVVSFKIINNSNQAIKITGYNYTIPNADGVGTSFTSSTLVPSPIEGVSPFGGEVSFIGLFAEVTGSVDACSAEKSFSGASSSIPTDLGFRNVTLRVFGTNENGDSFTLTGRLGLSFDDFDNC